MAGAFLAFSKNDHAERNGMEWSEFANEAEWSDERRGHCCISQIEIMPYAAFLLPSI
ncbi:MAG: hypothetical protein ACYCVH_10545 [Ignavibacteriaceae bacterium]